MSLRDAGPVIRSRTSRDGAIGEAVERSPSSPTGSSTNGELSPPFSMGATNSPLRHQNLSPLTRSNRVSNSSLYSLTSIPHCGNVTAPCSSAASSYSASLSQPSSGDTFSAALGLVPGNEPIAMPVASAPTAYSVSTTTSSHSAYPSSTPVTNSHLRPKPQSDFTQSQLSNMSLASQTDSVSSPRPRGSIASASSSTRVQRDATRSRSRTDQRSLGGDVSTSTQSVGSERSLAGMKGSGAEYPRPVGIIGVCALDVKARSKPSRKILNLLIARGEFEVVVFGDKVILDEAVEDWPDCDFLISFFSDGFPLDKAIAYRDLRQPFCVNDLEMQKILWDRRLCLRILDQIGVPTAKRIEVNRDGGPRIESPELAQHVARRTGVKLNGSEDGTGGGDPVPSTLEMLDGGETLSVNGQFLRKPFVEKPTSGEDHNIRVYFSKADGGGGRQLFRKIGNKSSELDPNLRVPMAILEQDSSYIYEQFLKTNNSEDVKAYTVGREFCHAETRKSPVVDGLVRRNTHGKEIRYVTELNREEVISAQKITEAFGQTICGFDLLRVGGKSYVIDINGWSFVKDNDEYYDQCAKILRDLFLREKQRREGTTHEVVESEETSLEETLTPTSNVTRKLRSHRSAFHNILHRSPSFPKPGGNGRQSFHEPEYKSAGSPVSSQSGSQRATQIPDSPPVLPQLVNSETERPRSNVEASSLSAIGSFDVASVPVHESSKHKGSAPPAPKHSWKLKGMVAVIRHADRTPKQKFKFTFHTKPFIDLLKGHDEEVLLIGEAALSSVVDAVAKAIKEGVEDREKLRLLRTSLLKKGAWPGTKVQIKPIFRRKKLDEAARQGILAPVSNGEQHKAIEQPGHDSGSTAMRSVLRTTEVLTAQSNESGLSRSLTGSASISEGTFSRISAMENDLVLDKLQLVIKWGGEPTHSARYQSQDLGENMRNEFLLLNRHLLDDVAIFSSSERRVTTSARIWASAFLDQSDLPDDFIEIRKKLLDDSNAAKDEMDKVKKKLKTLLRDGNDAPPQFAWPKESTPNPSAVLKNVISLMKFHKKIMLENFAKLRTNAASSLEALSKARLPAEEHSSRTSALGEAVSISSIQPRWCCHEDAELFKERWEKLFVEFCDTDKVDPSKISELYDTMKFDALHNRQFLEWVFTPEADGPTETAQDLHNDSLALEMEHSEQPKRGWPSVGTTGKSGDAGTDNSTVSSAISLANRFGIHRRSAAEPIPAKPTQIVQPPEPYFHFLTGTGQTKAKVDRRLEKLRELYRLAKILFDYICPQEYGIDDSEKLEIGLLTSLPLLQEIVTDLEELQASAQAKSFVYFTKESHIYTLLNCILEGGIPTKIRRNAIPELDYLSQICFELYESENKTPADAPPDEPHTFDYSIRISISPGAHVLDPLDVQLDAKHCIGCVPRKSLTAHSDWKQVIETLRARFHTVKLPQRFLAVNLSEKVPQAFEDTAGIISGNARETTTESSV